MPKNSERTSKSGTTASINDRVKDKGTVHLSLEAYGYARIMNVHDPVSMDQGSAIYKIVGR